MCDPDDPLRDPERLAALRATGLLDTPPEASFDRLVRLAVRLTGANGAAVSLVDDGRQFFKAIAGLESQLAGRRETPLDQSICQHVVASESPLVLTDARDHPGLPCDLFIAYLGVPLTTAEGHTLGSFCAFDASPRAWSADDIAAVTDLAAAAATEIELRLDIRRRIALERELSEAKGRFEAYMENSPAMAFAKDRDGRFTYLNARFHQHFRRDCGGLGMDDHDLWPAEVANQIRANDLEVWEADRPIEFIEDTTTADGRRNRFLCLKFPYTAPGGERLLGGMAVDISDLLRAQEALRRSEAESRTLAMVVARMDGAVAVADAAGRLAWASAAYARLFGESPEAVIGQDLIARALGGDDPAEVAPLRARLLAGERVEVATVRQDARGLKAWLELEVQAVRGEAGAPDQLIAIGRDVTARHRAERRLAALRSAEAIVFESSTLDEAAARLLHSLAGTFELIEATYWQVAPGTDELVARLHWTPGVGLDADCRFDPGSSPNSTPPSALSGEFAREVRARGRAFGRVDAQADAGAEGDPGEGPRAPRIRGQIGWPVICHGAVVGLFTFSDPEPLTNGAATAEVSARLQRQIGLFAERKRAEEERNRLGAILEASDDFVGIADPDGLVIWRNAAYRRVLGRDPGLPRAGFPLATAYTERSARLIHEVAFPEAARTGSWLGETEIVAGDGRIVPVSQRVMAHCGPDGAVAYFATILRDISASKAVQAELLAAKEVAEAASRAKGDFLANMSHEIRTPMNGILGMTELTLDTDLTPTQREYLGLVRSSAESLMRVINDILDFSKIESGRFELEVVPFHLHDILYETLRPLALRAHAAGLELVARVAPDVPEVVEGDPHRLRQVLVNLGGNAVKFTPSGEVVVEVTRAAPDDSAVGPGVALRFAVADTGIGIPAAKLAAIFEPFEQADNSTTRNFGGTGLGLSIALDLARRMGGRIEVASQPGRGSTFGFTARWRVAERQPAHPEAGALVGRRVVVAVANATRRRSTAEVLAGWGATPIEVGDGLTTLQELRRAAGAGVPHDLAVVDDQLADLGGPNLVALIRDDPALAGVGLVVMTTAGRPDAGRGGGTRAALCVAKPVAPRDLMAALLGALEAPGSVPALGPAGAKAMGGGMPRAADPAPAPASTRVVPSARPLRVLLAEDQLVNRKVAARMLERLGHSVVTAQDGGEVLARLAEEAFDAVLMDISMPVMDGFEAVAAIRKAPPAAPAVLIALTAHAMQGDRERCLAAGFDDYLSKPICAEDLRAALERVPGGATRGLDQRVAT